MRRPVLLNIDLGELPAEPEELYRYANLANIACGGHAGDDASMTRAVQRCRVHGARVGAHPSYPDRDGFGRRPLAMSPPALRASVAEQCARLATVARALGETVRYVKPHGALYHTAADDEALAEALVDGTVDALGRDVTLIGPRPGPGAGALATAAARARLAYAREAFADRGMRVDGTLLARDEPGALLRDPAACAEQTRAVAARGDVDTVCVHGDTASAVSIARAVRAVLDTLASA